MTVKPHSDLLTEWVSDKEDLAELVRDVRPYSGGDEYTAPGFFASDEEQQEFVAWVRAERDKELG